jgi:putative NADH-flavin reductase
MKLALFGATGSTGIQLIEQALAAGNQVFAYARNPSKIGTRHERLVIVEGELSDADAIERTVSSADAVISVLGPRPGEDRNSRPLTRGMQNILSAMQKTGVRRLIITSTPSASDPNDLPEFKFKILVGLIKTMMRPAHEEIVNVARLVRESDTEWTIVRVSIPTNNPGTGNIRAGYLGKNKVGTSISREDLAAFLLQQVQDKTWLRQAPAISN